MTAIASVLSSLKVATEIANLLRGSDLSLDKAEAKLKLADMLNALADARIELATLRGTMQEKDARIAELEEAFSLKEALVLQGDAYYLKDGKRLTDGPFCVKCWEGDHEARRLVKAVGTKLICQACSSIYDQRNIRSLQRS
jgi:hypothetical protein